ncbi:MAG: hypothetical protein WDK95_16795, partial [Syntrophorhabdaceae bacterium]
MKAAPPLHWACTYGRVPIARLLLDAGADVIPILLAYGATPSEDKLERVFQTAVRMNGSNPNRGPILTWYQENRPELYFSTFCTMEIGPGM